MKTLPALTLSKWPGQRLSQWLSVLGAALVLGSALPAQEPAPAPPVLAPEAATATEPAIAAAARFDANQLEQLLGPIALYPDALIALILPASTSAPDVVLAARYLREGGDAGQIENQGWDESVSALARYADVMKWMDENLAWTKQLGEAFAAQPTEVMNAVQRLRAKAQAAGSLVSTPQQQVIAEQNVITIIPAQPDVIYVPYYDPEIVYVSRPYYSSPFIRFSPGYSTGFWLSYSLDWGRRRICAVSYHDRGRYWRDYPDYWRRPFNSSRPGYVSPPHYTWTPRPGFNRNNSYPRTAGGPSSQSRPSAPIARPNSSELGRASGSSGSQYSRSTGTSPRPVTGNRQDFHGPRLPDDATAPVNPTVNPVRPGSSVAIVNRAAPVQSPPVVGSQTWNRGNEPRRGNGNDAARIRGTPASSPVGPAVSTAPSVAPTIVAPPVHNDSYSRSPRSPSNPVYSAPTVHSAPVYRAPAAPTYNAPAAPVYNAPVYSAPRVSAPPQIVAPPQAQPSQAPSYSVPAAPAAPSQAPAAGPSRRDDGNDRGRGRDRSER